MNKKLVLSLMVSSFLLISGCGGDDKKDTTNSDTTTKTENSIPKKEESKKETSNSGVLKGFLNNPESTEKFVTEMKRVANNGKMTDSILFNIGDDNEVTTVRIQRQDSTKLENVDEFLYVASQSKWQESPVKVTVSGKPATAEQITKASWDIDAVNWKAMPDIMKDLESRIKDLDGAKISQIQVREKEIYISINGTRKNATYKANLDGSFKSFE